MEKAPDAFRTISEVATDLNVPQHVLRFWESRFSEIKPMKRGGGRRYYRPDDVDLLRGIRHLLYGEGYTIRGVQRILKEQGLRYVQTIWQPGAQSLAQTSEDADFAGEESDARASERGRGLFGLLPSLIGNISEEPQEAKEAEDAEEVEEDEDLEEEEDVDDEDAEDDSDEDEDDDEEVDEDEDDEEDDDDEEDEEDDEEEKAAPRLQALRPLALKGKPVQPAGAALRAAISADDMRRLESALRELTECRRLLDAAIKQKV